MSRSDFWSRRKAAVEAESLAESRAQADKGAAVREAALSERPDDEILQELGLPDPDDLVEGDDFKVFLTETVPAHIRKRALRRLWGSNPVLANVDGLVDYGEDFTDASCVIENLQTTYQVGKGMTAHVEEMARQAEATQGEESDASDIAEAREEEPDAILADQGDQQEMLAQKEEVAQDGQELAAVEHQIVERPEGNAADAASAPMRRMRFRFEGAVAQT